MVWRLDGRPFRTRFDVRFELDLTFRFELDLTFRFELDLMSRFEFDLAQESIRYSPAINTFLTVDTAAAKATAGHDHQKNLRGFAPQIFLAGPF